MSLSDVADVKSSSELMSILLFWFSFKPFVHVNFLCTCYFWDFPGPKKATPVSAMVLIICLFIVYTLRRAPNPTADSDRIIYCNLKGSSRVWGVWEVRMDCSSYKLQVMAQTCRHVKVSLRKSESCHQLRSRAWKHLAGFEQSAVSSLFYRLRFFRDDLKLWKLPYTVCQPRFFRLYQSFCWSKCILILIIFLAFFFFSFSCTWSHRFVSFSRINQHLHHLEWAAPVMMSEKGLQHHLRHWKKYIVVWFKRPQNTKKWSCHLGENT